jgi:hypothetical protein
MIDGFRVPAGGKVTESLSDVTRMEHYAVVAEMLHLESRECRYEYVGVFEVVTKHENKHEDWEIFVYWI